MKIKYLLFFTMQFALVSVCAQDKKTERIKAGNKRDNLWGDVQSAPIESLRLDTAQALRIKQLLIEKYKQAHQSKKPKESLDSSKAKKILSVAWFDSHFREISETVRGEKISIAVLTSGYSLGDSVNVTISSDDEGSLVSGEKCREIAFEGVVNFENMAFLQNLFVVGEVEEMIVQPEWEMRCNCIFF